MSSGHSVEASAGFPDPRQEVSPPTARDAVEDCFRYLATQTSVEEVVEFIRGMDPSRIVHAVQGRVIDRPLEGLELMVANTVDWSARNGLLRHGPIDAVISLESVKFGIVHDQGIVGLHTRPQGNASKPSF